MPDNPRSYAVADHLHSAAIHLLRRLRRVDEETGLSPAALSALSVVVFGTPQTLGELAAAEHVRPASLTPIVQDLEADGLLKRESDLQDRRVVRVRATAKGRRLLRQGRSRRVGLLAHWLEGLSAAELSRLDRCAATIERLVREAN